MPTPQPDGRPEATPFHVHLRGVIDLLSRHIYSSPRVYLRELLQNGVDALTARRELDGGGSGIRIVAPRSAGGPVVVTDDGIGIAPAEMADVLATVGASSKRDVLDLPRGDFLGQFGIGLLSCFMVADTIVVRSRSAGGADPVEWRGSVDGTYVITRATGDLPIGTTVEFVPRPDAEAFVSPQALVLLAREYGRFLPVPITVVQPDGRQVDVTEPAPFLSGDPVTVQSYGAEILGGEPFDVIDFDVPATGTRGVGYVLAASPSPGARPANRVHLGGMLLSDHADILPSWAFFVRAVVDSTWLKPTASREDLVVDDALEDTRERLGQQIRAWILRLGTTQPVRMAGFVAAHGFALKGLALYDDELARIAVRWLELETSAGRITIDQILRSTRHVRYAETVDEFRQVASFERGSDLLVNGGYSYDSEIVRLLPQIVPDVTVERVTPRSLVASLGVPGLDDRSAARALERRVDAALSGVRVSGTVRLWADPGLPAVYVADDGVLRANERRQAADLSGELWAGLLDVVDDTLATAGETAASLCLNGNSPVIAALDACADEAVFARTVHLLYIQALLAGHHPLRGADRDLMNRALTDVLALGLGVGTDTHPPEGTWMN